MKILVLVLTSLMRLTTCLYIHTVNEEQELFATYFISDTVVTQTLAETNGLHITYLYVV